MDTDLNKETEFRVFFRENIVPSRLYRSVFPSYFLHRWICMQNTNDHRGRARKWSTVLRNWTISMFSFCTSLSRSSMIDCREISEENKQRQQTNEGTRVYLGVDKKTGGTLYQGRKGRRRRKDIVVDRERDWYILLAPVNIDQGSSRSIELTIPLKSRVEVQPPGLWNGLPIPDKFFQSFRPLRLNFLYAICVAFELPKSQHLKMRSLCGILLFIYLKWIKQETMVI